MSLYNFTLIIPTHNRHNYFNRISEYFLDSKIQVVVCDSSAQKYNNFFEKNINYLHLPGFQFSEKILYTINKYNSEFFALCADDDFIILDSLIKGFNFLKKNKSFQTVLGKNILFLKEFNGKFYSSQELKHSEINYTAEKNNRIFFSDYRQILWGIYSKKVIEDSFKIIKDSNLHNDNFIEFILGAVACHNGGIKFFESLWSIRELSFDDHWGTRHKQIHNYYTSSKIRDDFRRVENLLDKYTFKGYSKMTLKYYLNFSSIDVFIIYIKFILKYISPRCFLRLLYVKKNPTKDILSSLNEVEIDKNYNQGINKIHKILTKFGEVN